MARSMHTAVALLALALAACSATAQVATCGAGWTMLPVADNNKVTDKMGDAVMMNTIKAVLDDMRTKGTNRCPLGNWKAVSMCSKPNGRDILYDMVFYVRLDCLTPLRSGRVVKHMLINASVNAGRFGNLKSVLSYKADYTPGNKPM